MSKPKQNDNSVRAYLPPLYSRFVKAHASYTGESESRVVINAVKKLYDETPAHEREKILNSNKESS